MRKNGIVKEEKGIEKREEGRSEEEENGWVGRRREEGIDQNRRV
jgi:hypothetical protein